MYLCSGFDLHSKIHLRHRNQLTTFIHVYVPLISEARLSLAQACFPNDEIICDNGHDQTEVVYIAFTGDEAASGSNVTWAAINFEDFEASITDLANSLVQNLS